MLATGRCLSFTMVTVGVLDKTPIGSAGSEAKFLGPALFLCDGYCGRCGMDSGADIY